MIKVNKHQAGMFSYVFHPQTIDNELRDVLMRQNRKMSIVGRIWLIYGVTGIRREIIIRNIRNFSMCDCTTDVDNGKERDGDSLGSLIRR